MIAVGIKAKVVAKIGNDWFLGIVRKEKFHKVQKVTAIDDVKEVKRYLTLNQYLKLQGRGESLKYGILSKLGVDRLFVLPKAIDKDSATLVRSYTASVCDHCRLQCKANTAVFKCNKFMPEE
jgi:hypothetical protein